MHGETMVRSRKKIGNPIHSRSLVANAKLLWNGNKFRCTVFAAALFAARRFATNLLDGNRMQVCNTRKPEAHPAASHF